jgi:AhpD family alkylhydroperoxidase
MSSYLPGVEAGAKPGTYANLIDAAKRDGREYSKIWDLFAFAPDTMHHLSHLTQGIMRQPASISEGMRELIAAYTSHQNACRFCTMAHAAARRWSGAPCATSRARPSTTSTRPSSASSAR